MFAAALTTQALKLPPKFSVELNADLGEGGRHDAALLKIVKMANISCGAHAGTESDIRKALSLAKENGVRVGAHPGYPDTLSTYGRVDLDVDPSRIFEWCNSQISGLVHLATQEGVKLQWIKPHGAMYNQACKNAAYAMQIAEAAKHHQLPLMGLPGTELEKAAEVVGVTFIKEGFADRAYQADGTLVPRNVGDAAFIKDPQAAFEQIKRLNTQNKVTTICVHGDNTEALEFTTALSKLIA